MIPRVAALGHGFAGAGLYYLSDKRPDAGDNRPTPDDYMLSPKKGQLGSRVGFTETRNLPTRDPHKALRCMQWLAAHAYDVRLAAAAAAARAAGLSYDDYVRTHNPFRGRRGTKPVYTLSIAWHPSKDKAPSREQMIAAGDEVLRRLGLADRQCLMVSHTDTAHPHLHLIVNRVSPINGKFASIGNDWLKLSAWALDYERRTGQILCIERMLNWDKRRGYREAKADARKSDIQAKGSYVRGKDTPRSDHDWWKAHCHLPDDAIRAARSAKQAKDLQTFQRDMGQAIVRLEARIAAADQRRIEQLNHEIARRQSEHLARKQQPPSRARRVINAIRRMADALTGRDFRERRQIKALTKSVTALEQRVEHDRLDVRARYAKAWISLEKRHAAERARDERRIAERGRTERGEQTVRRARQQFNLRSDLLTARKLSPRIPAGKLKTAFNRRSKTRFGASLEWRSSLARVVEHLSGQPQSVAQLRRDSLAQPSGDQRDDRRVDGDQSARRQADKGATRSSSREAEIDAETERLKEVRSERNRRKRLRPRGRSRRIE